MKSISVALPENVAKDVEQMIQSGWFANEQEFMRLAVLEFIRHNRLELVERFQREDIQ